MISIDSSHTSQMEREGLAKRICNLLCILGSICMLAYGLKAQWAGHTAYATTLFIFFVFTLTVFAVYRHSGNWPRHRALVTSGLTFLFLYFLATGGESDTGLFWCYIYPLVIFAIVGVERGKWIVVTMIICSGAILYSSELSFVTHSYAMDMKHRFLGSIAFVSLMAYYMEKSRLQAQQDSDVAHATLAQLAVSDELTGTFNRRGIEAKVQEELRRVQRDGTEMSIVLCDADLFKRINDRYGHDVGDAALKHIAKILSDTIRVTDMVGRWGGEEFLIMLPNTSLEKGYQLIERVRERVAAEPVEVDDIKLQVSISCGICSTRFFSNFRDLIKATDISLYEAKAQGRNCTRPQLMNSDECMHQTGIMGRG